MGPRSTHPGRSFSKSLKNSGYVLFTHWASLIVTPSARVPAWLEEVERMFAALRANRFTAPVELTEDVAA